MFSTIELVSKRTLRYGIQLIHPLLLECHPPPACTTR